MSSLRDSADYSRTAPARLFILALVAIVTAEVFITFVVYDAIKLPALDQSVLDVICTTMSVSIALYLGLFRPLASMMLERNRAIDALRQTESELDHRVQERTLELTQACQAEAVARRTADVLRRSSLAFTQSLQSDLAIKNLFHYMALLIPYDRAGLLLKATGDEPDRFATFWDHRPRNGVPLEADVPLEPGDHPQLQSMFSSDGWILVDDIQNLPAWRHWPDHEKIHSWLGVPLRVGDLKTGLFWMESLTPAFFRKEHADWADSLAGQAAIVIQNSRLYEELKGHFAQLQHLSRRLAESQETERRNLARELHDVFGQALTSVVVKLTLIERKLALPESAHTEFIELHQQLQDMLRDMHQTAMGLHPPALEKLGLVDALHQYLETTQDATSLQIGFAAPGLARRLPADVEIGLFRIVQEAVTNVIRHAQAAHVDVLLERRDGQLVLVVEDDGVGFDPAGACQGAQLGLYGMRERAEALGGRFFVESRAGNGTTIQVEMTYADTNRNSG